jgi:hypothetical protein
MLPVLPPPTPLSHPSYYRVVPLELLRLPRLVRLALVRLLLPQDAANPLAHILPSTMQAVQVILDAMPEPGALLNQVYQLLLLEGDHISRQLTLAPQLPCSPPLEDACATFGPQEVTPLDLTSPTLLQDVVAAFLGHEAGVAGLELGQRQAGGGAGLAGRHQVGHQQTPSDVCPAACPLVLKLNVSLQLHPLSASWKRS